ncbi:MAG TPA: phosphomannomutase/phosphoglucomutase [Bryobacterales bacterium]|nr:phosphomannomutase/phosphoglucomutase [Bryobacterales bacterium]
MLKPTIFREYDIRGVAEQELLSGGIEQLGRAIGAFILRSGGPRVNVARDCRLSSPRLRDAIVAGLVASGCQVTDLGVVPTPLLYYASFHLKADGGVMITGSHNPPDYNGFKVMSGTSTIHGEGIQHLRKMIEAGDFVSGAGSLREYDIATPYVNEISGQFSLRRSVKVVCDTGNGTAGPVFHRLLERLHCEPIELFFEMDGHFPHHHPDPTVPQNLEALIAKVHESASELGIAIDGDGDRIGAVDEQGNIIWGDQLLAIYAREILTRKPGATFISEVKASQVMYDYIRRHGGRAVMWKTGHSLIKAKMHEEKAELAGEMSGHMFFADRYYGYDDALYSALRLIELVDRAGGPLSKLLADLPRTVTTPEIRVDCPDEEKFALVERVKEAFRKTHQIIDVDGVRVLFPEGWGLVRASNTQPVIVLRFEASKPELLNEYRREVEDVIACARAAEGAPAR